MTECARQREHHSQEDTDDVSVADPVIGYFECPVAEGVDHTPEQEYEVECVPYTELIEAI